MTWAEAVALAEGWAGPLQTLGEARLALEQAQELEDAHEQRDVALMESETESEPVYWQWL